MGDKAIDFFDILSENFTQGKLYRILYYSKAYFKQSVFC